MKPLYIRELQKMCAASSQREVADRLGVNGGWLSLVLHQKRKPGKKILAALGIEQVVSYRRRKS